MSERHSVPAWHTSVHTSQAALHNREAHLPIPRQAVSVSKPHSLIAVHQNTPAPQHPSVTVCTTTVLLHQTTVARYTHSNHHSPHLHSATVSNCHNATMKQCCTSALVHCHSTIVH